MENEGVFFSLKWKITLSIGCVFFIIHSLFSYWLYLDTQENFNQSRKNTQIRQKNIALAMNDDSVRSLIKFTEVFAILETQNSTDNETLIFPVLEKNWSHIQIIWGINNAVFFDLSGQKVKQWGANINPPADVIKAVINNEMPAHPIVCLATCFQFAVIPILHQGEIIGAFAVSDTFAESIIKYNQATGSDIGILIPSAQSTRLNWPYKLSALTHSDDLQALIIHLSTEIEFSELNKRRHQVHYQNKTFELVSFPFITEQNNETKPYFIIINDITKQLDSLASNQRNIWLYGIISLVCSSLLLLLILIISLKRVINFSDAMPLLAKHQYSEFRNKLPGNNDQTIEYDELDILHQNAHSLVNQLEGMEQEIQRNICQLMDQSQELANEKKFVQKLINTAPIIILTQDENGIILSANHTGINKFFKEESLIVGNVFDSFIPSTEKEHLNKLRELRKNTDLEQFQIDGSLNLNPTEINHISWIHSILSRDQHNEKLLILSLGMDITERKKIEQQFFMIATHDQLTGINNRHHFHTEFNKEIALAKRYHYQLALFYMDLDKFKIINDTSGHEAGDELLKLVARTIKDSIRETDILSRIGGDEFTLLMPNSTQEGVAYVAQKINANLSALSFETQHGHFDISASIGIAIFPQHGDNVQELLSNADLAMYQAKANGHGQFQFFDSEHRD